MIVVDTLRADHVYGDRARTPSMDSLIDAGLSFTRVVPEAMPTVPARNAILSGRRGFPFRGWHDYRGLMNSPGWFPLREPQQAWTSVLRRAGYFTGYVTDNPFLGFSYSYEDFRRTFDLFFRRGGQVGGTDKGVSDELLRHWMHPAIRSDKEADRLRRYLANGGHARSESETFAGRVFRSGLEALDRAAGDDRSRSSSTRSRRTSPGRRHAATSTCTAIPTGVGPSRGRCATAASRTGSTRTRRRASKAAARALRRRGDDDGPLDGGAARAPP